MQVRKIVKYTYWAIILIAILSLGASLYFLYTNFYQTIIQAKAVNILKGQVSYEAIDINLWDEVLTKLKEQKKEKLNAESIIVDPFVPFVEIEVEDETNNKRQ